MNTAKVYYIDDYSKNDKPDATYSDSYTAEVNDGRDGLSRNKGIKTSVLYGDVYNNLSYIPRVLALLEESIELLQSSSNHLKLDDEISSDNDVQHFLALLPELFCCRSIGDGFAAITTAIYNSIINQCEIGVLSENQISKILLLIKRLQTEPFLELEESIDLILLLDEADLNIKPQHLNKISEILCGE